jgi:hypothetical protein
MIIIELCGGMGNQLFQYYFGQYLSRKLKYDKVVYDESWFNSNRKSHEILQLERLGISYKKFLPNRIEKILLLNRWIRKIIELLRLTILKYSIVSENNFNIRDLNIKKTTYIKGFWQDYNYLSELDINNHAELNTLNYFDCHENKICVHIRRGDYLTNKRYGQLTHETLNTEYYIKALQIVEEKIINPKYIVFSDDIEWTINSKIFGERKVSFIDPSENDEIKSFLMMLQCNGYITANSTYSWWAAFINTRKAIIVISPSSYNLSKVFCSENHYKL